MAGLDPGWDQRFLATRRLIIAEPALLKYVEHYRAGVRSQVIAGLAGKLGLDADDLRLHLLSELVTTAFSVSGRYWVHHDGQGGRPALLERFDEAIQAIPASLDLSALPVTTRRRPAPGRPGPRTPRCPGPVRVARAGPGRRAGRPVR